MEVIIINIAIYSRKSLFTGKGDSIENQIEMCKNFYNRMYENENKNTNFIIYEDEGFTGANIKRPQFQQLLKDIKANKINVLICYRLDRISRNVSDFSNTLELLQKHSVDFISIKEQFDTKTPMGRAMVYIASVFAQLERETIAERVKDNMLELSKTGRWLGGQTPLGFKSEEVIQIDVNGKEHSFYKFVPIEEEIKKVNLLFSNYLAYGSIHKILKYCLTNKITGKNGGQLQSRTIIDTLKNPVYVKSDKYVLDFLKQKGMTVVGEANGNGILYYNKIDSRTNKTRDTSEWIAAVSLHKGIIDSKEWIAVQQSIEKNSNKASLRQGTSKKSLLSGVLKCAHCGAPMRISYGRVRKDGTRYYYYMCTMKAHSGKSRCTNPNAKGPELEADIMEHLFNYNESTLKQKFIELSQQVKADEKLNLSQNIENTIKSKTNEVDILLSQLSKTNNIITQELLLKKVDTISKEIELLEKNLLNSNNKLCENYLAQANINLVVDSFKEFNKLYSTIKEMNIIENADLNMQLRTLIERIVDKITYDGNTQEVTIEINGGINNG